MKHGTIHSYRNLRCPCDVCHEANRQASAKWRSSNYAKRVLIDDRWVYPAPPERHGRASFYRNYGCRCVPCTEGNTRAYSATRQRRRERLRIISELGLLDS